MKDRTILPRLQDLIFGDLWGQGLRCKHCIELATGRQGVKRDTPEIIAISKLRVERGGIDALITALEADTSPVKDTLKGISVVTGEWDVLVQLNGDDFDTVRNAVLERPAAGPGDPRVGHALHRRRVHGPDGELAASRRPGSPGRVCASVP